MDRDPAAERDLPNLREDVVEGVEGECHVPERLGEPAKHSKDGPEALELLKNDYKAQGSDNSEHVANVNASYQVLEVASGSQKEVDRKAHKYLHPSFNDQDLPHLKHIVQPVGHNLKDQLD